MRSQITTLKFVGGYNEIINQLGVWKIVVVIAILIPKLPILKEWAYAGFFFAISGAFISHLAVGQPFSKNVPSLILLVVTILSWYSRPADRKIIFSKNKPSL